MRPPRGPSAAQRRALERGAARDDGRVSATDQTMRVLVTAKWATDPTYRHGAGRATAVITTAGREVVAPRKDPK